MIYLIPSNLHIVLTHSVVTLLVNVSSFILSEMDQGNITAMLLLDLSSAFDYSQDHTILLNTLHSLGVKVLSFMSFTNCLC